MTTKGLLLFTICIAQVGLPKFRNYFFGPTDGLIVCLFWKQIWLGDAQAQQLTVDMLVNGRVDTVRPILQNRIEPARLNKFLNSLGKMVVQGSDLFLEGHVSRNYTTIKIKISKITIRSSSMFCNNSLNCSPQFWPQIRLLLRRIGS